MKYLFLLLISTSALATQYEDIFPHYYEYCSGSQLKYQQSYYGGLKGGIGGHGIVYVHGLCKDYSKNYPQVKVCDRNDDHRGVGISVDSGFKNVEWVAVPGRDLMFFGNKSTADVITDEDVRALTEKSYDLKIFEGVVLKNPSAHSIGSKEYQLNSALFSIGTDLALNWARELHCVKVPVQKEKLENTAAFLNSVNNRYYQSSEEFVWSLASNNCTHFSINIAHELGITKAIKTEKKMLTQIFNLAIPTNFYLKLVDDVVRREKIDVDADYSPNQFGSLMEKYPVFPTSSIFIADDLKGLTLPRKNTFRVFATPKSYERFRVQDRYSSLAGNAEHWNEIYAEKIKSEPKSPVVLKGLELIQSYKEK